MKHLRMRIANNVDVGSPFSANILGGARGYADACAVETHSNVTVPCIRTTEEFIVIGYYEEK